MFSIQLDVYHVQKVFSQKNMNSILTTADKHALAEIHKSGFYKKKYLQMQFYTFSSQVVNFKWLVLIFK